MTNFKTAESVSPGHPDKVCDQISDAILDLYLTEDPDARVAVDVAGGHGQLFMTGEISSVATGLDVESIVERLAGRIDSRVNIAKQSPEIARGVDGGGAGDQGIMIGYATSQTERLLTLEVDLSRRLNQYLYQIWPYDGKTQITTKDAEVCSIVASFQNAPKSELERAVFDWLDKQSVRKFKSIDLHINPAGDWQIGGFEADAGLTGRKLAVDNYGPTIPVGGGAFSGKDPSKVDRSGAYMARRIAIDYLRRYQANQVLVTLAYAIGYEKPLQATASVDGRDIVVDDYDLTPNGIINFLDLKKPIYEETARYGHFGHEGFSWDI